VIEKEESVAEATTPKFVWVDGKIVPWNEATIHITNLGTSGVSSVFEGVRAYWNAAQKKLFVFQLDAHLERFAQSMRLVRMKQTISNAQLKQGVLDLLRANEYADDMYIRPFAFIESPTFGAAPSAAAHIVLSTQFWPSTLKQGKVVNACVSSWTRNNDNSMPPRVKASSNYLNSRYASEEARRNGYDLAILLNPNGKVSEAPGATLMLVRKGRMIAPSVNSNILESITRETLIQLCRDELKIPVVEREVDRTELYIADEAFECGTGAELQPIVTVDRLPVGDCKAGPITQRIENLYHDLVRGIDTRFPEWRTQV
jgi:branched-chain amino acid aminotransferase